MTNMDSEENGFKAMKKKGRYIGNLGLPGDKDCEDIDCAFVVKHYASMVVYDIRGWVNKDKDKLSSVAQNVLRTSTLCGGFMKEEFEREPSTTSVVAAFAEKLDNLAMTLGHTDCNFVRCIKASNPLAAGTFTAGLVLNQLRYTGMLDTLSIRRLGFPSRLKHVEFWETYHVLDTKSVVSDFNDKAAVEAACQQLCGTIQGTC